ncbi:hypothetical protein EYF80_017548 [Liparis tanakae]|uniref:Uncharacterized protein n=1 Tax=Liparis tanakae TaxID=230148 RepID=A0A4Z2I4N6_9TELE|nr:hypothetical protein EYF80_017548 [Liparis tanakae]
MTYDKDNKKKRKETLHNMQGSHIVPLAFRGLKSKRVMGRVAACVGVHTLTLNTLKPSALCVSLLLKLRLHHEDMIPGSQIFPTISSNTDF